MWFPQPPVPGGGILPYHEPGDGGHLPVYYDLYDYEAKEVGQDAEFPVLSGGHGSISAADFQSV